MPPVNNTTQVTDAKAPQSQTEAQNAKAPSDAGNEFDLTRARRMLDSTNEKVNQLSSKLDKIDPNVLSQIAEKLGVTPKEAEKQIETQDSREVFKQVLWEDKNAERITQANKDGAFDAYIKQGVKADLALRLAEQDAGIKVDTSAQLKQNRSSSADASVDRGSTAPGNFKSGQYGIKDEDIEKYGDEASRMIIHR